MGKINHDKLIISLIKDHLIHTKLITGLDAMSINAYDYSLFLGDTIFKLMQFGDDKKSDQAYEYYLKLMQQANKINIKKEAERLNELADSIYFKLAVKKLEK